MLVHSRSKDPNPNVSELERLAGENNVGWIERAREQLGGARLVLLLGGKSHTDFRVRSAQAEARDDVTPSSWSHCGFLEANADATAEWSVCEVSLERFEDGRLGSGNAIRRAPLKKYGTRAAYPNVALVALPNAKWDGYESAVNVLSRARADLDLVALVVHWLGYVWGVEHPSNPLGAGLSRGDLAGGEVVAELTQRAPFPRRGTWWGTTS
jgi:hypothetical protein